MPWAQCDYHNSRFEPGGEEGRGGQGETRGKDCKTWGAQGGTRSHRGRASRKGEGTGAGVESQRVALSHCRAQVFTWKRLAKVKSEQVVLSHGSWILSLMETLQICRCLAKTQWKYIIFKRFRWWCYRNEIPNGNASYVGTSVHVGVKETAWQSIIFNFVFKCLEPRSAMEMLWLINGDGHHW